jgi:hypothetical protein
VDARIRAGLSPWSLPRADHKELRRFGLTLGLGLAVMFGLCIPWLLHRTYTPWPWAAGAVLVAMALAAPASLRWAHALWTIVMLLVNRLIIVLIGAGIFFLVMTPIGMVMRLARKDAMARKFDPRLGSYRLPSKPAPRSDMERPF